jgi:hypothetical protein
VVKLAVSIRLLFVRIDLLIYLINGQSAKNQIVTLVLKLLSLEYVLYLTYASNAY